jgi:hypothetical protein
MIARNAANCLTIVIYDRKTSRVQASGQTSQYLSLESVTIVKRDSLFF